MLSKLNLFLLLELKKANQLLTPPGAILGTTRGAISCAMPRWMPGTTLKVTQVATSWATLRAMPGVAPGATPKLTMRLGFRMGVEVCLSLGHEMGSMVGPVFTPIPQMSSERCLRRNHKIHQLGLNNLQSRN